MAASFARLSRHIVGIGPRVGLLLALLLLSATAKAWVVMTPDTLEGMKVGQPFSQAFQGHGGNGVYAYTLDSGTLVPGLNLSGNAISGTPTRAGPYDFTIRVSSGASTATYRFTGEVDPPSIRLVPGSYNPPVATWGQPYSYQMPELTGGTPGFTWSMDGGSWYGISISPGGLLSGTPTGGSGRVEGHVYLRATDSSTGTYAPFTLGGGFRMVIEPPPPPVAHDVTVTVDYGSTDNLIPLHITGGTPDAVMGQSLPTHGTATVSGTSIRYTPNPGYHGEDSFTYAASNPGGTSAPARITITVREPEPIAHDVTTSVPYNSTDNPIPLDITGGTPTSMAVVAVPAYGTATVSGTSILYTPNRGYLGQDTFQYRASNGSGSGTARVTITVTPPPLPVAHDVNATVPYNSTDYRIPLTITHGAPEVVELLSDPREGAAYASGIDIYYTPPVGFRGRDHFSYFARNAGGQSHLAYIYLIIEPPSFTISDTGPTAVEVGVPFSRTFTFSGGHAPYTAVFGSLPAGVSVTGTTPDSVTIGGTPTSGPGDLSASLTVTDSSTGDGPVSVQSIATFNIGLNIPVSPAPPPVLGEAYAHDLTASGGMGAPYTFSVVSGALPPGMQLAPNGHLSGTPTQAGSHVARIRTTDSHGNAKEEDASFTIAMPTLSMTPAAGTLQTPQGKFLHQPVLASGGHGVFDYALSGALPPGVGWTGNALSGMPTQMGSFPVSITATLQGVSDAAGQPIRLVQQYTLEITAPVLTLLPADLPIAVAGEEYGLALTVSGGHAPYRISHIGTLPPGMVLDSDGVLHGTPGASGSYWIRVTVTDSQGHVLTQAYVLDVRTATLVLSPNPLPDGEVGKRYAQALQVRGGIAPHRVALSAGRLPPGLVLEGNTLTGTPTEAGSFRFSLAATDSTGDTPSRRSFELTLVIAPEALVLSPSPGTLHARQDEAFAQVFTASGGDGTYRHVLSGVLPRGLSFDGDRLAGTPGEAGQWPFEITLHDGAGASLAQRYTLVVEARLPELVLSPSSGTLHARQGEAFAQVFTASGGDGTYRHMLAGALPQGLSFDGDTLAGTPDEVGQWAFEITLRDGRGVSVTQTYTLLVEARLPELVLSPAATTLHARQGEAFAQVFSTSGGDGAYRYTLSGVLPQGLSFSGDTLAGTPREAGEFAMVVTAHDGGSPAMVDAQYLLVVAAAEVVFDQVALAEAMLGIAYEQVLSASGGTAPYAWAVTSGALPAGLALGSDGVIRGVPTQVGTVRFEVGATDAHGAVGKQFFTLAVSDRPDPGSDAEVTGLLQSQAATARRFAGAQLSNFQQRMERLHGSGERPRLANGLGFSSSTRRCTAQTHPDRRDLCEEVPSGGASADPVDARTVGNGWAAWIGGSVRSGSQGRGGNGDFQSDGLSLGADYRIGPSLALGVGVGWGRDDSDVGEHGSRSRGESRTLALYGSAHPGDAWFVDGVVGYQSLSFDLWRRLAVREAVLTGSRDGSQWFGSLSVGADLQPHAMWQVTPYARLDVARATLDAYAERGDDALALRHQDTAVRTTTGNLGVRAEYRRPTGWGLFTPMLRLEYQHDISGSSTTLLGYADGLSSQWFPVRLEGFERNRTMLGLGARFGLRSGWGMLVEYRGLFGGDRDHGVMLNLDTRF